MGVTASKSAGGVFGDAEACKHRDFGATAVSLEKVTSHPLDDIVDGCSARDVLGKEGADEFA